ncbi:uncharacterized protein EV154DRAFT_41982 [Mucor mucedo]|uniref:uncharacterized protein n=1 Tax=Mucor mucedo TaxID=29922 RepID=UPI00221EEFD2|nr:uncharacterized protein EV154DRAFT_41982 [Mucor mucedo]KAI7881515.1 hypothetical protein EV154DRAFT_41982 [Mucor mucedo]
MSVGNRNYGTRSSIKRDMRHGGQCRYTSVCVTNEYNTSQTCVFCFSKTNHPYRIIRKNGNSVIQTINGTSSECVSVLNAHSHKKRDTVSALAIGLTCVANLLFYTTFPSFHPNISQSNTDFQNID